MKKLLSLAFVLMLLFSLAACGNSQSGGAAGGNGGVFDWPATFPNDVPKLEGTLNTPPTAEVGDLDIVVTVKVENRAVVIDYINALVADGYSRLPDFATADAFSGGAENDKYKINIMYSEFVEEARDANGEKVENVQKSCVYTLNIK